MAEAKESEYLSPVSRTPFLEVTRDDGTVVYREQSTGQEYDEAWVKDNAVKTEKPEPDANEVQTENTPADESQDSDQGDGPATDTRVDESQSSN